MTEAIKETLPHSTIEKINRQYALIYIDREGETLKEDFFTTESMTTAYYMANGPIQWNTYLIIPEEVVVPQVKDFDTVEGWRNARKIAIDRIQNDDSYTRKIVLAEANIENFIATMFPEFDPTKPFGRIKLIKGENWADAQEKSRIVYKTESEKIFRYREMGKIPRPIPSWHRDHSMFDTLTQFDLLRADMIRDPNMNVVFYTHIQKEYNIALQKFNFMVDRPDEQFFKEV